MDAVDIFNYTDYRDFLHAVYKSRKKKGYSYITFTEECGLGHCNAMHLIISGKRPLTNKAASIVAKNLPIQGKKRQYFIALVAYQREKDQSKRKTLFEQLISLKSQELSSRFAQDQLAFFTQWYHSAIYELLSTKNGADSPEWISKHLVPKISPKKATESIELLIKLQLISYDEKSNIYKPTKANISTGAEIRGMVFKSYHQQMIQLGLDSLSRDSSSNRDITSVTTAVPKDAMSKLKKLSSEFRQKVLQLSEANEDTEEIIQVNIQIFPLTKKLRKD